jgi:ribonuclease-3
MAEAHRKVVALEALCGYEFRNKELAQQAITHPSAVEGKPVYASYERLEFLGDSVLGMLVALDMYREFSDMDEGELTRLKVSLVSGETLSRVGQELGLDACIIFGESEMGVNGRGMKSALENVFEAVVGALYLDGGVEVAHGFVRRTLSPHMSRDYALKPENPKSQLQEYSQSKGKGIPEYKLMGSSGPAHAPTFTVSVLVDGERLGRGQGSSKKEAEAAAARDALTRLGV